MLFMTVEFWYIVRLTAILRLKQLFYVKEKLYFSLICSFYSCLVKES